MSGDDIQSFGQQGCEVFVFGTAAEPIVVPARLPEFRWCGLGKFSAANFESQVESQAFDGDAVIIELAATLGRLTDDTGWQMLDHNGRFGLVAMLATGSASPLVTNLAVSQQKFDRGLHWM